MDPNLMSVNPMTLTRRNPQGEGGPRPERRSAMRTGVEGPRPERGLAVRGRVEGFTILEVMIASTIILLVLVGLLSSLAKSQQLKQNTGEYQVALEAARQKFEEIQSTTYSTVFATYNNTNFAVTGLIALPQDADGRVGRVTVDNTNANLLLVTISLQWQGVMSQVQNGQASVQSYVLTTQLADRNR